jgi:hypothetical protein
MKRLLLGKILGLSLLAFISANQGVASSRTDSNNVYQNMLDSERYELCEANNSLFKEKRSLYSKFEDQVIDTRTTVRTSNSFSAKVTFKKQTSKQDFRNLVDLESDIEKLLFQMDQIGCPEWGIGGQKLDQILPHRNLYRSFSM